MSPRYASQTVAIAVLIALLLGCGRASQEADGTAAAVEKRQLHVVSPRGRHEGLLRLVEHPGRGERAGLLRRIGVAQHDFLPVASACEVTAIGSVGQQLVENSRAIRQRVGGLE